MKKKTIYFFLLFLIGNISLMAQVTVPEGINYQAYFQDQDGEPLRGQELKIEVNLISGADSPELFYQEIHEVATDELGLVNLAIGEGKYPYNRLADVPWERENIWLQIKMLEGSSYKEVTRAQMFSVPYAMHAESATEIINSKEVSLRDDQSIFWYTSGNAKTEPNVHYLGTGDNKRFFIKTDNETRFVISKDGRVNILAHKSKVAGNENLKSSYPLVIERGRHGIWIQLSEKTTTFNNYVTFADIDGIKGRIEGETRTEYFNSFRFEFKSAAFGAKIKKVVTDTKGEFEEASKLTAGISALAAGGAYLKMAAHIADGIKSTFEYGRDVFNRVFNIGVRFKSGGADYAEWLPKEKGLGDLSPGQVVGQKGGIISLSTESADRFMVVSSNPIVLGNSPKPEKEHLYEKVAFLGQVKVWVIGKVRSGDYILPSGNNDGYAIGVAPEKMLLGDYARIIGVAWEDSDGEGLEISQVNVAIGINANDLSEQVEKLEKQADNIIDFLQGKSPLLSAEELRQVEKERFSTTASKPKTELTPLLSHEAFDQVLDENATTYELIFSEAEKMLEAEGYDLSTIPELEAMFTDPISYFKAMRRNPMYSSYMAMMDQIDQKKD